MENAHVDGYSHLVTHSSELRSAVDSFKDDLEDYLADHPMELTRGLAEMIEVLPPGASKALGLEVLLRELSIPTDQVKQAPLVT